MDRRSTLKKLMMASGALVALPSWARGWAPQDLVSPTAFAAGEQEILASIADTIIPAGDSIGALSMDVDKFLQRLFTDCYEKEVTDGIKSLLEAIDQSAQLVHSVSFVNCTQDQRLGLLNEFAISEDTEKREAFELVKSETIRGFMTSREVMTSYHDYQIAPGHYHGCVEVKI